jgi:hypothetical protein
MSSNFNREQKKNVQNNNFYYPEEMPNKNKVSHVSAVSIGFIFSVLKFCKKKTSLREYKWENPS